MSKFGWICELRFDEYGRAAKDIFPIVYENKTLWYCKRYGCDILNAYSKPESVFSKSPWNSVIPYAQFRMDYQISNIANRTYTIYVAPNEDKDFSWLRMMTDSEVRVLQIKEQMKLYERELHSYEERKKFNENSIDLYVKKLRRLRMELDELEKEITSNE